MTKKSMMADANARYTCVICGRKFTGWGHNPEPCVKYEAGRACSDCNGTIVVPIRIVGTQDREKAQALIDELQKRIGQQPEADKSEKVKNAIRKFYAEGVIE